MTMSGRQKMRMIFGDRLAIHQAMTPDLAVLYPFFHESGLIHPQTGHKLPGITLGYCGQDRSGGMFNYDPRVCYRAGIATDLNIMVMGRIGRGKSAFVKKFIRRSIPWGNRFLVTDIKGEYGKLVEAVGGAELKFGGDTKYYLNPLDPDLLGPDGSVATQLDLLMSMALTLMNRTESEVDIEHETALRLAIKDLQQHYGVGTDGLSSGVPVLAGLVEKLLKPTQYMLEGMRRSNEYGYVRDLTTKLGLALNKLTADGDLSGMFDRPTTPGLYQDTPLTVMNLKDLDDTALRLVARVHNFLSSSQFRRATGAGRYNYLIHDESWKLVTDPFFLRSTIQSYKLGRSADVCNMMIFHHLNSLIMSGYSELVRELASDTGTIVSYTQKTTEIKATAEILGLNESAVALIPDLPKFHGLWKVGDLAPILVEDVHWPGDKEIVETSHLLMGHSEEWWDEEIERQVNEALALSA